MIDMTYDMLGLEISEGDVAKGVQIVYRSETYLDKNFNISNLARSRR